MEIIKKEKIKQGEAVKINGDGTIGKVVGDENLIGRVECMVEKSENKMPAFDEQSIQLLIAQAVEKGTPVETMEKLLAMRKELKAEYAKEQFDIAMANFQSECPVIVKTAKVLEKDNIKVRYMYAPLDTIVEQVKGIVSKYGLSYTIRITNDEKNITATCKVTHSAGHSEESAFVVPIGTEQFMSESQKYGARATFAKRYAFCNAFGIMTGEEDNEEVVKGVDKKENYIELLKYAIHKKGAKNIVEAIEIYNNITGLCIKEFPKTNEEAKELYNAFINSPINSEI